MGTNYYLRKVKPREVHDEYHIAKLSAGWLVHFQDSTPYQEWNDAPSYHSVDDIMRLLESGEWQISDEYGYVIEPGEKSIEKFKKLCEWVGGERFKGFEPKQYTPSADIKDNRPFIPYNYSYRDPQGFYFDRQEFS